MPPENPFQDPLRFERRVPECVVVIFGANGDLTKRKLLPALYSLASERRLPAGFAVLGISRTEMSDDQFRDKMRDSVGRYLEGAQLDPALWSGFAQGIFYMAGDVGDSAMYQRLAAPAARDRRSAAHRRQLPVLPFDAAQPVRPHRSRAWLRGTEQELRVGGAWWWRSLSATTWRAPES